MAVWAGWQRRPSDPDCRRHVRGQPAGCTAAQIACRGVLLLNRARIGQLRQRSSDP